MKFLKNNPVVYLTRKMWEYSIGNRKQVILYASMISISNILGLFEPLLIALIFNTIQLQGVNNKNIVFLGFLISIFIFLNIFTWIFHGPARIMEQKNAFLIKSKFKKYLLSGTMSLPMSWHTDHHSGDTIDKIEKGTGRLNEFSENGYEMIESFILLVGSYIALIYFNIYSAFIIVIMIILAFIIVMRFDKYLMPRYAKYWKMENAISAQVYDAISNISTVIILRVEKLVLSDIMKKVMEPFGFYSKNLKVEEIKWFLVSMLTSLMTFAILFSYIWGSYKSGGVILIGTLAALYSYVNRINGLFYRFAYVYSSTIRKKTGVANSEEISNQFVKIPKVKAVDLATIKWKSLEIKNLKFSYNGNDNKDLHLDDISINIGNGEKIAFVGESGSGKTTMLKIIRELYQPKSIKITLDGKPLEKGFSSISENISLIPQDPEIFNSTIRQNITMGHNYKMNVIKKYTDMAMFTEVAMRLPKKYESSIVEKGVNLSGGEKQRLALSRGLLASANKSIVLLDEPTSSVDTKNELAIYENIFKAFKNKTIISSIHRLHLLPLFDKIYLFEQGKIVDEGNFSELKEKSERFKTMWEKYSGIRRIA